MIDEYFKKIGVELYEHIHIHDFTYYSLIIYLFKIMDFIVKVMPLNLPFMHFHMVLIILQS
jgi:hypothetical protein